MKISTNWIKDYIEINEDLIVLASTITNAGVNIESITSNYIDNLKIGYVLSVTNHPDSDHLHVCQVDLGDKTEQIVCGAKNVKENIKVIVALPGAVLPDNFIIKKSVIRGVESNGMICALSELGLESKEEYDKGIEILNNDAIVGANYMDYASVCDTIYTLDLNPNRNDCLSHLGFAYEVASVTGNKVTLPNVDINEVNESINDVFKVKVDTENCYRYSVKMVRDVVIKDTPDFIKNRLTACGMRSINNVVDISNYIMLEYGQPLHFFDADKLGSEIIVRMANNDEKVVTLDNKERTLTENDIVITDSNIPVCVAGVMGGASTEVDNNTKNIIIESAIFNPYNTRYTSINLNLRSEASLRYEKPLNAEYSLMALNRACHLLEKYASGKVLSDTITVDNIKESIKIGNVSLNKINNMLGVNLSVEDVIKSLNNLGFNYEVDGFDFIVTIPNRRMDINDNSADIIEEIGRINGYDKIKSVLPKGITKSGKYIGNVYLKKLISKRLRSLGLNETRTYTLVGEEENNLFKYDRKEEISLLRPLSNDKKIIRQTLIPSLINVYNYNKKHGVKDVLIYEVSNTYYDKSMEDTKITVLMKGTYISNWNNNLEVDFYLIKGVLDNLLDYLGYKNRHYVESKIIDSIHPGMGAIIYLDKEEIGIIGKVHPSLIKDDVYVFELSMNKLNKIIKPIKHKEISKYPVINKDVSFIIGSLESKTVVDSIRSFGGRLLTDIKVFDVYEGNERSVAYTLTFSDSSKTLTDDEVNVLFENIINKVTTKLNCKIKSV